MTNAEKYKKELRSIECTDIAVNKFNGNVAHCDAVQCEDCSFKNSSYENSCYDSCNAERVKWLIYEYEDVLRISRLEYEILKYLSMYTSYKYIAKNKDCTTFVFKLEPYPEDGRWISDSPSEDLGSFGEVFLFLDWKDEPMLIDNILERAKVIGNE